jgi:hypothetical protein
MQRHNDTVQAILAAEGIEGVAQRYDKSAKRLLADAQLLSHVLSGTVRELEGTDPETVAHECLFGDPLVDTEPVERDARAYARVGRLPTEDSTMREGVTNFDIRTTLRLPGTEEGVLVEVDVESQNDEAKLTYPLSKRMVYYIGRMLSIQGESIVVNKHYERLRRVMGIWIVSKPYAAKRGTITHVHFVADDIIGSANYDQSEFALADIYIVSLNDKEPGTSEGVLGMLEILFASSEVIGTDEKMRRLEGEYGIILSEETRTRMETMDSLSGAIYAEGMAKGEAQLVCTYMERTGATVEEALDFFRIYEPKRSAVIALIEGRVAPPVV